MMEFDIWNLEPVSVYTSYQEVKTGEDNWQQNSFKTLNSLQQLESIVNDRIGKRSLNDIDYDLSAKRVCNFESEKNLVVTSCLETGDISEETNDVAEETNIISKNQFQSSSSTSLDDKKDLNKQLKIIKNRVNLLYKQMVTINTQKTTEALNEDYSRSLNSGACVTEENQKPSFQMASSVQTPNVKNLDMNNKKLLQKKIERDMLKKALELSKNFTEKMKTVLSSQKDQLNPITDPNQYNVQIDLEQLIKKQEISFNQNMNSEELPKVVEADSDGFKVPAAPKLQAALLNPIAVPSKTQLTVSHGQMRRKKVASTDSDAVKLNNKRQENIKLKNLKNMVSSLKTKMASLVDKPAVIPNNKYNFNNDDDLDLVNRILDSFETVTTNVTTHSTEVTTSSSQDSFEPSMYITTTTDLKNTSKDYQYNIGEDNFNYFDSLLPIF